jgi:hypothetical protein
MKSTIMAVLLSFAVFLAPAAHADWHGGKVTTVQIAYDGRTIVFTLAGHSRTNCTCYSPWPNTLCLNRARDSFKEEVAMLYSVRARAADLNVNIDEATCSVVAMYETD